MSPQRLIQLLAKPPGAAGLALAEPVPPPPKETRPGILILSSAEGLSVLPRLDVRQSHLHRQALLHRHLSLDEAKLLGLLVL